MYFLLLKIGILFLGLSFGSLVISEYWYFGWVSNNVPPMLYSSLFLITGSLIIQVALTKVKKKIFKWVGVLISLPISLSLSGLFMGGLIAILNLSLEKLPFYISYWGLWGVSFGFFFGVPIYLIVIFLLCRDHWKKTIL
ncbi:hypothetical protein HOH45_02215 [bacterium]|jgi:hypothetical protein|nr:hypothetical protein [bacterium]